MPTTDIHPETLRFLQRQDKERLLGQKGLVIWLCGLPGAGKATIASAAERILHHQHILTAVLLVDNLRSGLNADLGSPTEHRLEPIRRVAEVARILASQGIVTIISAVTPHGELRDLARGILGHDFFEVYVKSGYPGRQQRLARVLNMRGEEAAAARDPRFEEPQAPDLVLDTDRLSIADCTSELLEAVTPRIR